MSRYQPMYDNFQWERHERFNFISNVMDRWADEMADAPALYWTDDAKTLTVCSFAELKRRCNRTAALLAAQNIARGDVALILLSREQAWWDSILACLQIGVVASPGTTQLTEKDVAYRLEAAEAKLIIANQAQQAKIDAAIDKIGWRGVKFLVDGEADGWLPFDMETMTPLEEVADTAVNDHALYYFTSGTTGHPKMTVHGHGYPVGHEATGRFWINAAPEKVIWNISDTGWAKAAWTSLFAPWLQGAAIFAHHTDGFDPQEILQCLERFPITTLCAPPTAYRMFVRLGCENRKFNALEKCVSAGEPLNPEVINLWKEQTGFDIFEGYGQTETPFLCGSFDGMEIKPGSMGLPAPGIHLAVIDGDGQEMGADEEGDIAVNLDTAPPGMFLEYKNDRERTELVYRKNWYLTGDRATRDADGYFWFVGRSDDVILSSGYRIGPFEVESVLFEHEAVAESAVVASPDPVRGEVVKAFVVLSHGLNGSDELIAELQDYVKQNTAPYKYPRKIEFVDHLPKTVSGKIKRSQLKKAEWAANG